MKINILLRNVFFPLSLIIIALLSENLLMDEYLMRKIVLSIDRRRNVKLFDILRSCRLNRYDTRSETHNDRFSVGLLHREIITWQRNIVQTDYNMGVVL